METTLNAVPSMTPEAISGIIQQARHQEAATGQFRRVIETRLPELHGIIGLESNDPAGSLVNFAVEYVDMAPRLIECVDTCAQEAEVSELFQPFVTTAIAYFTSPSVLLASYEGLEGLLIKAYQSHRLMEEMYENNRSFRNSQLVDVEATQANLLVHHLIGEPFANELDQSILITVRQIAGSPDYYDLNLAPFVEQASRDAWSWMREYWLNLLNRNQINFRFSYRSML